jgi:hypothetical protein
MLHRRVSGLLVLTLTLWMGAAAQAQAIKQLPENPWLVFKLNNPQAVNQKVQALAQKLGLANLDPAFADPLAALKKQFNLQAGFNDKGEFVVSMFEPAQGDNEPRFLALVPVSDYEAFLKNLTNAKTEGELTTFNMPDDDDPIYAIKRDAYAAISPWKDLVQQPAAGADVGGLAGKQLQANDFVVYANVKALGAKALPEFQKNRANIVQEMERGFGGGVKPEYVPAIKAIVNQFMNFAERVLTEGQAATLGFTLSDAGLNTTFVGEFTGDGYLGQTLASFKSTDGDLLTGLPNVKYFAFGGMALDPAATTKVFDDALAPVQKELANVPAAQAINTALTAARTSLEAMNSARFGYAAPTAPPGQQSMIQQVAIVQGDAKKLQAAQREYIKSASELFKILLPPEMGNMLQMDLKPDAKDVAGVKLDQLSMKFNFDMNTPQGAQTAQMIGMIYGPDGSNGVMGPIDDKTYITIVGGTDQLLAATIAAAKANEAALAQAAHIKVVADQLPKQKVLVFYIAVDNIANQVLQFMAQMGMNMPLKLPPDVPPIGISAATEANAFRIDAHFSSEMIGNLVSTGIQFFTMMQGGGGGPRPGAL